MQNVRFVWSVNFINIYRIISNNYLMIFWVKYICSECYTCSCVLYKCVERTGNINYKDRLRWVMWNHKCKSSLKFNCKKKVNMNCAIVVIDRDVEKDWSWFQLQLEQDDKAGLKINLSYKHRLLYNLQHSFHAIQLSMNLTSGNVDHWV